MSSNREGQREVSHHFNKNVLQVPGITKVLGIQHQLLNSADGRREIFKLLGLRSVGWGLVAELARMPDGLQSQNNKNLS